MRVTENIPQQDLQDAMPDLRINADSARVSRMGLAILLLGFGGFLAWAALAPLDEGVPTEGVVSLEGNHKVIQHLMGGIVSEILVHEGQMVQAGDMLIRLDDTATRSRAEEIRQHYYGLLAQESRLRAEKAGAATISFHPELLRNGQDPMVQQYMRNQSQLLHARQQAMAADIAGMQEAIEGQQALIEGYKGILDSYRGQLALLEKQLGGVRELAFEGYAPRNQQNELEQKAAQLQGDIANTEANLLRSNRTILELNQRISARRQTEMKEIDTEMSQVMLAVQTAAERYKPASDELRRIDIVSPVSGQVVGLQVHTIGAVIQPGQKIMDIVPVDETLLLDARIPPHLIDRIHAGQIADVRFSSFSNSPQLLLEGKVRTVSSDLLTDQSGPMPISYYLARIAITPEGMQTLGERRLQPGMPAQIVVRTGERTLLTYLMHPLVKRIAASMKEE
jgi:protease secretion system membrane fusion protein